MEKLAVFYGGKSCEHEVSVITALQAMAELEGEYDIIPVYINKYGWFSGEELKNPDSYKEFDRFRHVKVYLINGKLVTKGFWGRLNDVSEIDVALVCNHGGLGEGGGISSLLEMEGIPYTCASSLPSAVCLDKEYFKIIAKEKGFKTISGICINKRDFENNQDRVVDTIIERLGESVVVKPVDLGSSIGVNIPSGSSEIKDALSLVYAYTDRAIVEKRIVNMREFNCACFKFGDNYVVSAIEEPKIGRGGILSYKDKYLTKSGESKDRDLPANIPQSLASKIRKTTQNLYQSFNLSGVVRVDYIYDEKSKTLYVNEANTIPGSLSGYLYRECGLTYVELIKALVDEAKAKKKASDSYLSTFDSELLSGKYFVSKG